MKSLLSVALLALAGIAQSPVCVTGVVEPVGGPTICQQGETHRLAGTRVLLRSSAVVLGNHVGQNVRIVGTDIGLLCNVVDVSAVLPPTATLSHCGTPMPGCTLKFLVGPGGIGRYVVLAAFGQGFQPLGCVPPDLLDGALLLAPSLVTLGFSVSTGPPGALLLNIPNLPVLSGQVVWLQGARQDLAPVGPIEFTNVEVIQVAPFLPPCGGINC